MKLARNSNESLILELNELELLTLKACLRESFAVLDRHDFPLRVGVTSEEAARIAGELASLMDEVGIED